VVEKVLLAFPRGYCAGVERAVDTVERALHAHGPPVYVEDENEVPDGALVVLSAHGVAPEVYENAAGRRLVVIDATCPLVTKVHLEARRFSKEGRTIILIGHRGHEEVVGTSGQAPGRVILVGSVEEAGRLEVADPENVAYLTQTTLSVDETAEIVDALRERFPRIEGPPKDDICYATQNRQDAVKELAGRSDVVLVIGSGNSSNSNRLAEVAREQGTPAFLVDDETRIEPEWIESAKVVGVTSGASAPDWLVERMMRFLEARGATQVEEIRVVEENVRFSMPATLRRLSPGERQPAADAS
jgi:4-hydroxy-3-methylbut-2-enyl diphosphate reductase